jgi:hypothetical protein
MGATLGVAEQQVNRCQFGGRRRGAASLDYVLVIGVILPLAAFLLWVGPRAIRLVYDMIAVMVGWPFM